jgi:TolA-binding protein
MIFEADFTSDFFFIKRAYETIRPGEPILAASALKTQIAAMKAAYADAVTAAVNGSIKSAGEGVMAGVGGFFNSLKDRLDELKVLGQEARKRFIAGLEADNQAMQGRIAELKQAEIAREAEQLMKEFSENSSFVEMMSGIKTAFGFEDMDMARAAGKEGSARLATVRDRLRKKLEKKQAQKK